VLVVATLWLYLMGPAMVSSVVYGTRSDVDTLGSHLTADGPLVSVTKLLAAAALGAACVLSISRPSSTRSKAGFGAWLVLAVPAFAILADYVQGRFQATELLLVFVAVTCIFLRPTRAMFQTAGLSVVLSAAVSLAMGLQGSGIARGFDDSGIKDMILGSALAGPFSYSNNLGMAMALGTPLVLKLERRSLRWIGCALVALTMVWSASRTAMAAAAAAVLVMLGVRLVRISIRTMTVWFLIAMAASVATPFFNWPANALSRRGAIWRQTVGVLRDHLLLGIPGGQSSAPGTVGHGAWKMSPHNAFLGAIMNGGLGLAIGMTALVIIGIVALMRHMPDPGFGFGLGIAYAVNTATENFTAYYPILKGGVVMLIPLVAAAHWTAGRQTGWFATDPELALDPEFAPEAA
jgi:hypothetical protein